MTDTAVCPDCGGNPMRAAHACPTCGWPVRSFVDRLERFRKGRLTRVVGEAQPLIVPRPVVVCHIVASGALAGCTDHPQLLEAAMGFDVLRLMSGERGQARFVGDGVYLRDAVVAAEPMRAFVRVFETGAIEAADASCFEEGQQDSRNLFAYDAFVLAVWTHTRRATTLLRGAKVPQPYWLLLSVLGIGDHALASRGFGARESARAVPIEDDLILPAVELPDDLESHVDMFAALGRKVCHAFGHKGFGPGFHEDLFQAFGSDD
ncbi:MAG: hypothetical protein JXA57_19565 [Armatimonadetes bacterium]|nr:hypothetical protein [Armatimonadota bacterium]